LRIHRPLWHEGILLLPQLFQQQEAEQAWQHHQLAALASPFPWGVSALALDPLALSQGQVRLEQLAGRFPDGTAFDTRISAQLPPARHLDALDNASDSITLWLALPLLNPLGNNLHQGEVRPEETPRRYRQQFAQVPDHMGEQEDELAVEQLNGLLRLFRRREFHEGEAAGPAGQLVQHQVHGKNGTGLGEMILKVAFTRFIGEVAHK
jgi:type VI secretion system protein ImpJ